MNSNQKSLVENLKGDVKGLLPYVNPVEDLVWKKEFIGNSWFYIGHFESEGHKLNYLFHLMIIPTPDQGNVLNSMFSITDETTGWHQGENFIFPLSKAEISENEFYMKAPNGVMSGNFDRMRVQATMPHGKVDLTLNAIGHALYNGGGGVFKFLGIDIYQYSIPTLLTTGVITIEDKNYEVNGISWFDRQWQNNPDNVLGRWSWMDLNLDNGDKISLWDVYDLSTKKENAWATVLHPDGTQTVVAVEPLSAGESDYWLSEKSAQRYPTHWVVKIPSLDACLEVIPSPREQELLSEYDFALKYEGACSVKGSYKGKDTTGFCYVELVGVWK